MLQRKNRKRYERLFILWSDRFEKWMVRVIIGLIALLLVSQLLLQISAVRVFLVKVEQLEGVPYRR